MLTVQKMHDDLDYWIHLGIGDDIVKAPQARPEYQHLVRRAAEAEISKESTPDFVRYLLRNELKRPAVLRSTTYRLIWLRIKRTIFGK